MNRALAFTIFISVFLLLFGGMHLYLFLRVRAAFTPGTVAVWIIGAALVLMTFSPMLVQSLAHGHPTLGNLVAWVAYPWVAIVFWFFSLGLLLNLWNLGTRVVHLPGLAVAPRAGFFGLAAVILVLCVWGLLGASNIRTEHATVATAHLPPGSAPIRIAQVSDLHLGLLVRQRTLGKVLKIIRGANPDLLVATGDLVDVTADSCCDLARQFSAIAAPLGKFAVLGNHEFYAGMDRSVSLLGMAGFRVLRQEAVDVGRGLTVAGVDDPSGRQTGNRSLTDEGAILPPAGAPRDAVLFLKHQPTIRPGSLGRFDLQLSGHTHKGQIFPFTLLVQMAWKYPAGLYDLGRGSRLYTSRGTGTWGPPFRVLSPPEVTLITLVPAVDQGPSRTPGARSVVRRGEEFGK
jgi:hypothetical protein